MSQIPSIPPGWVTVNLDWGDVLGPPLTVVFHKPKCECGSEKAKIPGHSTWCPKYEEL